MPISNNTVKFDAQQMQHGLDLLVARHVELVIENHYDDGRPIEIVGYCVRQTTIREEFIVRIYLNEDRSIQYAHCACPAGVSGQDRSSLH